MLFTINKEVQYSLPRKTQIDGVNYSYHIFGDLYLEDELSTIKALVHSDDAYLSKLMGNFTIILSNPQTAEVKLLSDRPGKQNIFYCFKDGQLLISDDFWEMKDGLSYGIKDIDVTVLKQQIMFFTGLNNKTIMKGVKTVPAASIVTVDFNNSSEKVNRYWSFHYKQNTLSYEEKLDLIDDTFNNALGTIKKLNPNESSFAVGISGGLDSRVIPHYAQKNNMNIEGFTIGIEKPRKLLLSNDFKSANKIASYFNIERKTLRYDSIPIKKQLDLECQLAPEIGSQIFKIANVDDIKSNTLVTGASGFIVGASPLYDSIKRENLIEHTLLYQSLLSTKPCASKFKKAINSLTGIPLEFKPKVSRSGFSPFFSEDEFDESVAEIESFYDEFKHLSKSEKLLNYATFGLGRNNDKGAFESFLGQKKSYSIYTPFFLDTVQQFNEDELLNRSMFQEFITKRLPELADIQGQDFKPTLLEKNNYLSAVYRKYWAMSNFVIRGNGVMNYENWVNSSSFSKLKSDLNKDTSDIQDLLGITFDYSAGNVHPAVKLNILKMQNVLMKF